MMQVVIYHIALFILTRAFPLLFYVGAILLDNFFCFGTSLSKSVVRLVKMSMFLYSLAICQVSWIFVADYG